MLITAGTAICGSSAIAALAPAIAARPTAIAISLAVVFSLNALALVLFPPIGQALGMVQHTFGLWSALAIHDTSSVVGASLQYGPEALQTGTSVKMARALWIVPLVMVVSYFYARKADDRDKLKPRYPLFIAGFIALAALVTFFPVLQTMADCCFNVLGVNPNRAYSLIAQLSISRVLPSQAAIRMRFQSG